MAAVSEAASPFAARVSPRVDAAVLLDVALTPSGSRLRSLAERGGFRARVTGGDDSCEVYLLNPSGGLAGGDRLEVAASVAAGARLLVSTASAERVYRSCGPDTRIDCRLTAAPGATLEWLPQQTIFYEASRYRRSIAIEADSSARVTVLEAMTLGRIARGERLEDVVLRDDWRVRRAGRLLFAEALRMEGSASRLFERAAIGAGATAAATLVHVAPDATTQLDRIRGCLGDQVPCGASALEGLVVARWLAPEPMMLIAALKSFLEQFRGRAAPRGW
ncbi:MAG TPA: urease accessory protein UreD [Steroidobacteraceae bacterium]|jgi:urease accessory protein